MRLRSSSGRITINRNLNPKKQLRIGSLNRDIKLNFFLDARGLSGIFYVEPVGD